MREPDVRDEGIAEALDGAVSDLRPADRAAVVVRAGRRRQALRVVAATASVAVFVAAVGWAGVVAGDEADGTIAYGSLATEGWALTAPASWTATPIAPCEGVDERPKTGVIVSSVPFTFRDPEGGEPSCEDRFVFDGFPADGVVVSYEPTGRRTGIVSSSLPDTVLPFGSRDLTRTDSIRGGPRMSYHSVVVDGDLTAFVRTWVGPEADDAAVRALSGVLGSLEVAGASRWASSRVERTPPEPGPDVDVVHPDDWQIRATEVLVADADVQSLLTLASPRTGESACTDGSLDPRDGVVVRVGWWTGGGWGAGEEPSFPDRPDHLSWRDGETSAVTCPIGQVVRTTFRFADGGLRYVVDVTLGAGVGLDPELRSVVSRMLDGLAFGEVSERSLDVTFASRDAPWSFEYPDDWDVRTYEAGDPASTANYRITTVANGPIPEGGPYRPGDRGLPATLGDTGAVVSIERFWSHETSEIGAGEFGPGASSPDRATPGWTYVERARCEGTLCWHVLEWLGPHASRHDRAAAERLADSVRLADIDRWTETDGVRTTLHDEDGGFTVTYPAHAWDVAPINRRPSVPIVPLLHIATLDMSGSVEGNVLGSAIERMHRDDVVIALEEVDAASTFPPFPDAPRPPTFRNEAPSEPTVLPRRRYVPTVIWFVDAGRGFRLSVLIGDEAPRAAIGQAWAIADSLRFLATPG